MLVRASTTPISSAAAATFSRRISTVNRSNVLAARAGASALATSAPAEHAVEDAVAVETFQRCQLVRRGLCRQLGVGGGEGKAGPGPELLEGAVGPVGREREAAVPSSRED